MRRFVIVVVGIALVGAVGVGFYGNEIRGLFGASTASLSHAGRPGGGVARVRDKALKDFSAAGCRGTRGDSYAWLAPARPRPTGDYRFSTFSIDVDTASYALARRTLFEGQLPPAASVRVEEFVNSFRYRYPNPDGWPFGVHLDAAPSPFEPGRMLLRVGLQARRVEVSERKSAHLVFLVDVSGSMQSPDRLPLAIESLRLLTESLRPDDTVGLVTYAGEVREVLPPTSIRDSGRIFEALGALQSGGGTAMGDGLELAYRMATGTLRPDSTSRVIVLTDGDANIGATRGPALLELVSREAKEGVTLSVVGFGRGNYQDATLELLADRGNGNYTYIDSITQARRVFVDQVTSTIEVLAKDVKIQVEFDPTAVRSHRLLGYDNRALAHEQFRDDRADAGELGPGHTVTALYELELLRRELRPRATVRVRWKEPGEETAEERVFALSQANVAWTLAEASAELRFAVAVAGLAEILRANASTAGWQLADVERLARESGAADDPDRREFLQLVAAARGLRGEPLEN